MKKQLLLLTGLMVIYCLSTLTYGQYNDARRWTRDPRMSQVGFFGNGQQFSEESLHYKNPNTKTHIFDTRAGVVTVGANFRVHPSGIAQSEVPIVSSSINRYWIFGSSNAFTNNSILISEGIYLSTDGGQNWFGSDTCGITPLTSHGGDPGPAIGPDGRIYMSYLDLYGSGLHAGFSTNWGANWSSAYNLTSASADKNLTTVNEVASSPYYGRALVAWSDFSQGAPPIMVSWSSNDGTNWSTATDINTSPSGHYCQGVNPQVGPNGEFYLVWADPITGGNYTEDYMGFAKSTDGGVTWAVNNDIYDVNGIRGNLANKNGIRVNGFPWMGVDRTGGSRNGWIYVVEGEINLPPAGTDPDIVFHRSTDGGTTWSAGIRVNQDPLNNGADQYMPALCVGDDGSVNVVYYDSRNTPTNQAQVYVSHSTDGGDSWTDVMVSDHNFTPSPIPGLAGGYQGDYIGICTGPNGTYFPLWADNSSGVYQAWTAEVTFEPPCTAVDPPSNPNPANGATDVDINLSQLTWSNGAGANTNELYFGTDAGNLTLVQSGTLATSWTIDPSYLPLSYFTNYYWKIIEMGDTCNTAGPTYSFRTIQDPNYHVVTDSLYPQSAQYWTGYSDGTVKHDGTINNEFPNTGWAVFDISSIPSNATVDAVSFYGYINSVSFPYWSATPMGSVYPVTDDGPTIFNQIQANYGQSSAYIYSTAQLTTGWYNSPLGNNGMPDLQTAVTNSQGWFAMGFVDWDFSSSWWLDFDGWSDANPPFIQVTYHYITPVEMTSFTANSNDGNVMLNWSTATETNNRGFQVERKSENGQYEDIAFVDGHGTTTNIQQYSYVDKNVTGGKYTYRLKQMDFDGKANYSNEVEVEVKVPLEFALGQNYPNPFNPTTQISYSIAKDGFVNLTVYNTLGQQVASLVNENVKAGKYQVTFDASRFASGVYYYRLQSSNKVMVKKMMLLK